MGKLVIKADFNSGNWSIDNSEQSQKPELFFSFIGIENLQDFHFGYRLMLNGNQIQSKNFPENGVRYVHISSAEMFVDVLDIESGNVYDLHTWATSEDKSYSFDTVIEIANLNKPHPSWVWINGAWASPVPYPEDENFYIWSESDQNWKVSQKG